MATIDDYKKLGVKTAKILSAEKVEGSDKLLKLMISLGGEEHLQLVSGIGKAYTTETLVGKTIIVLTELEPKMLMGIESQGMLLAATKDGLPILLTPEQDVEPGTSIS